MKRSAKCKCLHCRELFVADFRNRGRQRHCGKPQCRKAAKALSQRLWLAKEGNQNYFRGPAKIALGFGSGGRGIPLHLTRRADLLDVDLGPADLGPYQP